MEFSFSMLGLHPDAYGPLAQHAEKLGFECLWFGDHVVMPDHYDSRYPYDPSGRPRTTADTARHDIWVTVGYLAGLTKRIRFGTGVYILPLRKPFVAAQAIAMAQNLSHGRVILGVGTGWLREEFAAVGEEFEHRGARMDEQLDVLEKLWSGDRVEHHGRWYQFGPVRFAAAPAQRVPLIFGGHTTPALVRAAKRGDGWMAAPGGLEESIRAKRVLDDLRDAVGTDKRPFTYYVHLEPPVTADGIRRYEDLGFDHLIAPVWAGVSRRRTMSERIQNLDEFVEAVAKAGYRLGNGANES